MSSVVIPGLDLAPNVPSRVVTVDVIDSTEGRPASGAHVDFILPQDLHASTDGKIIKAGTTRMTLDSNGHGEIRVPAYSSATKPEEWVLLVKKSWAPHPYPIRVAPGASKISLASLIPPMEVSDSMAKYVPTDARITLTQGAAWNASVDIAAGLMNLKITVPPGGTAFYRPTMLTETDSIESLDSGLYGVSATAAAKALGLPQNIPGNLLVTLMGSSKTQQYQSAPQTGASRLWIRSLRGGVWSDWTELLTGTHNLIRGLIPGGTDLRDVRDPGMYQVTASQPVAQGPEDWVGTSYTLEVLPMGTSWLMQRATNSTGQIAFRTAEGSAGTTWRPWKYEQATTPGGGALTGGMARTAMEITGLWTTHAQENAYLDDLATNRAVSRITVGQTVQGKSIYGIRAGNPAKPTLLIIGTQHGDEPGPREGAMMFARDLANATTLATLDMCVIVIPTVNVDKLHSTRSNANAVNLNRDWNPPTQPETLAISTLFSQYNIVAVVDAHSGGYARQVSLREAEGSTIPPAVRDRSLSLYNAVFSSLEENRILVRRYSDEEVSDDPALMRNGVAKNHGIPTLLLEIPSHWSYDPPAAYNPPPYWQATMGRKAFHAALNHVYENLTTYNA